MDGILSFEAKEEVSEWYVPVVGIQIVNTSYDIKLKTRILLPIKSVLRSMKLCRFLCLKTQKKLRYVFTPQRFYRYAKLPG